MMCARDIRIRGVVQGVGFRPFVFRLARAHTLSGWVLNGEDGVEIHLEGAEHAVDSFVQSLQAESPPASSITAIDVQSAEPAGLKDFTIRDSRRTGHPTVRISPDLPVCDDCLAELFDRSARRYQYPYINCTNCGPRYSVVLSLPYDRRRTTMREWPLDDYCTRQYCDPVDRRFHAQPVACPVCGPHYRLVQAGVAAVEGDEASIRVAVEVLKKGGVVAVKGLGGYHLGCDAGNPGAVLALRGRKYRKEKPFALMVKNLEVARGIVDLSADAESLMLSAARPVVLAPAKVRFHGVAPDNDELGVMLPYAPLHHLLFAAGAPDALVMTSANRSSEPIAYEDDDALQRISGLADAFLIGERPIARRVDDSVTRAGAFGPVILRRSRGYAPSAVAAIPSASPLLATGADLKNAITLVVNGEALVSQHIGDLDHYESFRAFRETIEDLMAMYDVGDNLIVAHDLHPQYHSTTHALELSAAHAVAIQHHRAHIASVLAEREAWDKRVLGVSFDGTGYGDDGSIWGGEIFAGSIVEGFARVAHLRPAALPGGDAAALNPVQAAAGFLAQVDGLPDLQAHPFLFPARYEDSLELVRKGMRTFPTTSMGRLFDAAAALLGFTREVTFEGQAAMWLERIAGSAGGSPAAYSFPLTGGELDFRPLLRTLATDRFRGRNPSDCARAFQRGVAQGLHEAMTILCESRGLDTVVLSGGVFQNEMLLTDLRSLLATERLRIWTNHAVPPNDGGISLGQAALAAFANSRVYA